PGHDDRFGGCFLIVTEVKSWGVQGYVAMPEAGKTARAYYRVHSDQMARIGRAEWVVNDDAEE
ncbi:MAG TPA: hypothetical protein VFU81_15700, partial [Thermomicrobiales bacterium]|nr:hypothetical protein [Thermomicrobiales bacterium]